MLVDARALVGTRELLKVIGMTPLPSLSRMTISSAATRLTTPLLARKQHDTGIARGFVFNACADDRRFGNQQRNRLALHVRTHQRAVRVVVLEERNQYRSQRKSADCGETSI